MTKLSWTYSMVQKSKWNISQGRCLCLKFRKHQQSNLAAFHVQMFLRALLIELPTTIFQPLCTCKHLCKLLTFAQKWQNMCGYKNDRYQWLRLLDWTTHPRKDSVVNLIECRHEAFKWFHHFCDNVCYKTWHCQWMLHTGMVKKVVPRLREILGKLRQKW